MKKLITIEKIGKIERLEFTSSNFLIVTSAGSKMSEKRWNNRNELMQGFEIMVSDIDNELHNILEEGIMQESVKISIVLPLDETYGELIEINSFDYLIAYTTDYQTGPEYSHVALITGLIRKNNK